MGIFSTFETPENGNFSVTVTKNNDKIYFNDTHKIKMYE